VQTIHETKDKKLSHFAKIQESCKKDVERCLGLSQSRFQTIQDPCCQWDMAKISCIMYKCTILLNMIIQDAQLIII
jgi:hypothetical protein